MNEDFLDHIFSALSDRTRRGILAHLSENEASVSDLAEIYNISLPGILKHLKVLEKASLVSMNKQGRVRKCNFDPAGLQSAEHFINEYKKYWEGQFDRIEQFLAQTKKSD